MEFVCLRHPYEERSNPTRYHREAQLDQGREFLDSYEGQE
jgi:hypothetical protein